MAKKVVVTYDGSDEERVYLDGSFIESRNVGVLNVNTDEWFFGGRPSREFLEAEMDDIRIYKSVLSAADIQATFDASKATPDFFNQQAPL